MQSYRGPAKPLCHLGFEIYDPLGCYNANLISFVEAQGFGGGPKNHNGLDVVPYLEWDEELGKPSVLHLPVPHSWPLIDPEFRTVSRSA